ncbi:UNVERIFIED_CONTAM: two-component system response regulator DctR [Brevibacillus sp. OAP136]
MTKILIVDDDEKIRFTLREISKFAGFESIAVDNGKQALAQLGEEDFDLVLVDYYMPEMDGLETVKAMREINREIPVVILTVDERPETVSRFFAAGATDFSLKPVRAADLISRLQINLKLSQMTQLQKEKKREVLTAKGISPSTLQLIIDFLQKQAGPVTLEETMEGVGLAYPTVYRYITHLLDEGWIYTLSNYRKIGRPKNQYVWKGVDHG